jgi:hypothetical protein
MSNRCVTQIDPHAFISDARYCSMSVEHRTRGALIWP